MTQTHAPQQPAPAVVAAGNDFGNSNVDAAAAPVVHKQPVVSQPMNPQQPHAEQQPSQMGLRGGDGRGGLCPGRFCFIIPCPLPCDCCVFPCPC